MSYLQALWYHWVTNKGIPDIWFIDETHIAVRTGPVVTIRPEWV